MNKNILLLAMLAGSVLSGCSQTVRYVTNQTWFGRDELFVSTSERSAGFLSRSWQAKVISCQHQADHSLKCTDQAELNQYLNAENTEK
jgi:hypothetical protein